MTDAEKRPVGRPSEYKPEYCDQCVEFMAQGYSLTAFAGSILVSRHTINNWMAQFPEFLQATRIGQAARTQKLENTLLLGETGPKVTGHIFALKNADPEGWKDKHELDHGGQKDNPIQTKDLTTEKLLSILTPEQLAEIKSGMVDGGANE